MADITGTAGNDVITGTDQDDYIDGGAGNDRINGGAGNDTLVGGTGADTLTGDAGNDTLYGGAGNDGFFGGGGNDVIYGEDGIDTLYGDGGDDTLNGGVGNDTLNGGTGNDQLYGGAGTNIINGGAGLDTVYIDLTSAGITSAVLDDFTLWSNVMEDRLASAGGSYAVLAAQTTTGAVTLSSIGLTLSGVEFLSIRVDGVLTSIADLYAFGNQAPVSAATASALTDEDTAVSGIIAATDPNGDALTWTALAGPANGSLELDASTGQYTYTPNANFNGADSFQVSIEDRFGATAVQTITVGVAAVNDAPATDAAAVASTDEDTAITGQVVASDIDGDSLGYAVAQGPSNGTLSLNASTGAYTYTPAANFNGSDSFQVVVADPSGATAVQTITVGVAAVNDAPVTDATAAVNTDEDKPVSGQVVASDVDGDVLGYAVAAGPANGTLTLDATTGAYTYNPGANFNGADSFQVTVSDASGASAIQTVSVGIAAVNDTPVTDAAAAASMDEDTAITGQVVASDIDGDTLGYAVAQGPSNGTLSLNASTGAYTYTAAANYSGSDTFSVSVSDGHGGSVAQQVNVAIGAVADAPAVTVANINIATGFTLTGTNANETLNGGTGDDMIQGGSGNDVLNGDGPAKSKTFALNIGAALVDLDGSETLTTVTIGGVPATASLSAGVRNVDGTWSLTAAQLPGLAITSSTATNFALSVTATSTESTGQSATTTSAFSVTFDQGGNNDILVGGAGNDTLNGGTGNDTLDDGANNDLAYGGNGDDLFIAGLGDDTYDGGAGFDTIDVSLATSSVKVNLAKSTASGLGTDKVVAIEGIVGSAFSDTLTGNSADNKIDGGAGVDTISGGAGNDTLYGGSGNDQIDGGSGNDIIYDGTGDDMVTAGDGNDYIYAGSGLDTYVGGTGFDTLDYSAATGAISVDAGKKTVLGFTSDTMDGIEKVIGSSFDDNFKGGKAANYFDGGAGNDTFRGMGGTDTYTGGTGDDTYVWFVKDVQAGIADLITDFYGGDKLNLHEFVKAFPGSPIDSVVKLTDGGAGTLVSVKIGTEFFDLVMLQGVHDTNVNSMLANGQILT